MDKTILDNAIEALKNEMRENLQTFYDALPPGQQNKILKNETIKAICDLYGVKT